MATLSTLVPDVRVEIPEVPSLVVKHQLLRAAREFTEQTRSWRVNIKLATTEDISLLDLTALLPSASELVDIISIKNSDGGEPPTPRTFKWLDENVSDWRDQSALDARWYVADGNNTIRLVPTPSTTIADKYFARVAVKPLMTATTLDDVVLNKHDQTIIHGALGRLFAIPRKLWTDSSLAAFHLGVFNAAIPAARTEAAEEFQTGVPRTVKYGGI